MGGREGGKRRKAGECGTRRVGPYASAPNTDNADRSSSQRRQAGVSSTRGKPAAGKSTQATASSGGASESGGTAVAVAQAIAAATGRQGGREGGREREQKRWMEGGRETSIVYVSDTPRDHVTSRGS